MQQYNIFQAIYLSFYSKKLYRDVALNWGGKSFLYLFVLLAIVLTYFAYSIQHGINIGYQAFYTKISPQIPVITIVNGRIVTPENRPYFISDPVSHYTYAIIDTSGQYKTIEQAKTSMLVTQNELISQSKPNEIKIYKVPANMNQTLDPKVIDSYIEKYLGFAWIIFYIIVLFLFYIYRILQALLYAILGKIFAVMCGVPLTYGQIIQIMMVAITPVIILSVVLNMMNVSINHETLLFFILAILYLCYGIIANKSEK